MKIEVYCYSKRKVILTTEDRDEAEQEKKQHRLRFGHIVGLREVDETLGEQDSDQPENEEE